MPKAKTHRGAAKRFKTTGSGRFIKNRSGKNHMLEKKTTKRKRRLRQPAVTSDRDNKRISRMLPHA